MTDDDNNVAGIRPVSADLFDVPPPNEPVDTEQIVALLPEILDWAVGALLTDFDYDENIDNAIGLTIRLLAVTADRLREDTRARGCVSGPTGSGSDHRPLRR